MTYAAGACGAAASDPAAVTRGQAAGQSADSREHRARSDTFSDPSPLSDDDGARLAGDIETNLEALLACSGAERLTPEFGWLAGLTLGRMLAMDRASNEPSWQDDMQDLCGVIGDWTFWYPDCFIWLFNVIDPAAVFGAIVLWPERHRRFQLFIISCLLGFYEARGPGTRFLHDSPELVFRLLELLEDAWRSRA